MWIACDNPATRRLKLPMIDESVEFDDEGRARVRAEIGRALADHVDRIRVVNTESEE